MGVVLLASDLTLGRTVAIKVIRSQETDPNARDRLVRKRMVARLSHENVVTVHAVVNPPDGAPTW